MRTIMYRSRYNIINDITENEDSLKLLGDKDFIWLDENDNPLDYPFPFEINEDVSFISYNTRTSSLYVYSKIGYVSNFVEPMAKALLFKKIIK